MVEQELLTLQTMIFKTLHRKRNIEQHESHKNPGGNKVSPEG
jgi:hypothetical protein